ncbi:MAG: methyltransferase domain-containing protein [Caldilineaceae bacterium]|nr:methyltransferase domain-containing protein [Caldilineaceae bacterium]
MTEPHASEAAASLPNTWRKYLTDYNEGLGLVYERFVLNDFLNELRQQHDIQSVLEAPLYGMAGVSGINDVIFAQHDVDVTMVDDNEERLAGVRRIWAEDLQLPVNLVHNPPDRWHTLPFADNSFDLTWEWAGLWYIADPEGLLRELVRTSRNLVFVAMPNNLQVGYWLRKLVIDRDFFRHHDERWTDIGRIRHILEEAGVTIIDQGVLDVPPWPDTVMPANEVLKRLGIRSKQLEEQFTGEGWQWSTMAYYLGQEPDLYDRVIKYAWLDHAPLPWQVKAVWAHHRYLLGRVST